MVLEVLNELDALKASIAGGAGRQPSAQAGATGSFWETVAGDVEILVGTRFAEAVGNGLKFVATGALQQLARAASDRKERKNVTLKESESQSVLKRLDADATHDTHPSTVTPKLTVN